MKQVNYLVAMLFFLVGCKGTPDHVVLTNPIIPGYFADPSLVENDGVYYLYATSDPWGADSLVCWSSDDFLNWKKHVLNWPTKPACTSALSNENKVWAPSVIKRGDNYYMYISVGSEVWCGTSKQPLGPWKNMLGDQPLLAYDTTRYLHVIDAEVFIDEDNKAYLYWGSGWDWINGRCFVAELNDDMCSFKTEPKEITPTNYFEGPFMLKHDGLYYLTYSDGKTIDDTYKVRYAIGESPYGPFVEAENSPILQTDESRQVFGPGHHTVFQLEGQHYILYHRHDLPFNKDNKDVHRRICIDKLDFDKEQKGVIKTIVPSEEVNFPHLKK